MLYCFIQLHFSSMHGGLKCDTTLKRTTLFYITIGKLCFLLYCCFALLCPQSNSHFMFCPHGINSRALLRQVVDWKNRKILHQCFHHCKYFCFACFVLFKNLQYSNICMGEVSIQIVSSGVACVALWVFLLHKLYQRDKKINLLEDLHS